VLHAVLLWDQQRQHFEVNPRLRPAHLRDGLFPVLAEIPKQRTDYFLAQPVTRASQSSGWVASGWVRTSGWAPGGGKLRRLSSVIWPRGRGLSYSPLMLAAFMIGHHFSISAF
jgi:hypothetical protein